MKTAAEKKAQAKYDKVHKDEFLNVHLKIRKDDGNELVLKKLASVAKQTYILELIKKDIKENGI